MFKPLLIAILALAVVTAVVFVGGKYLGKEAADETAGWNTYRNEKYGFEFRYPSDINGKPTGLVERQNDFLLFETIAPGYQQRVIFSAKRLSDFEFPISSEKSWDKILDVGNEGSFEHLVYSPATDSWYFWFGELHQPDGSITKPKEFSWDETFDYLMKNNNVLETDSGDFAFYSSGGQTEGYTSFRIYRVFNLKSRVYFQILNIEDYLPYGEAIRGSGGVTYTEPSVSQESVNKENQEIRKFMEGVVRTLSFN